MLVCQRYAATEQPRGLCSCPNRGGWRPSPAWPSWASAQLAFCSGLGFLLLCDGRHKWCLTSPLACSPLKIHRTLAAAHGGEHTLQSNLWKAEGGRSGAQGQLQNEVPASLGYRRPFQIQKFTSFKVRTVDERKIQRDWQEALATRDVF